MTKAQLAAFVSSYNLFCLTLLGSCWANNYGVWLFLGWAGNMVRNNKERRNREHSRWRVKIREKFKRTNKNTRWKARWKGDEHE